MAGNETNGYDDEEMTVELELDDGKTVNCAIITILTVAQKDYIVLLPLDENGNNEDGEVWFYRYEENESNPDAEPSLSYIDNDEEYETVADAFDEYLDNVEFDEIVGSDKNEEETSSKNKEENPLLAEGSPHFSSKNKEDNQ